MATAWGCGSQLHKAAQKKPSACRCLEGNISCWPSVPPPHAFCFSTAANSSARLSEMSCISLLSTPYIFNLPLFWASFQNLKPGHCSSSLMGVRQGADTQTDTLGRDRRKAKFESFIQNELWGRIWVAPTGSSICCCYPSAIKILFSLGEQREARCGDADK